jgi:hypothetical protein
MISRVSVSCSWCHTMNRIGQPFCAECGHRADVARMDCDCRRCRTGRIATHRSLSAGLQAIQPRSNGEEPA